MEGTKKSKKTKEPQRKTVAGPTTLTTETAPGSMRKSIAGESSSRRSSVAAHLLMGAELFGAPQHFQHVPVKDNTATEGKIKILQSIDTGKEALCCKYNEEYEFLAVGCTDGGINIYQAENAKFVVTLTDSDISSTAAPVTGIQHRSVNKNYPINNCFTCTYANGWVKNWNYNFEQCIYTIKEKRETYGLTYHPRYPKFVTYGDDLKIYLYDEETKTQERILTSSQDPQKHDGPTSRVFAACFNPKNNYELITGGWDDVVHFWDLRQPHSTRQIGGVHICGEGIDISAKGTEILTCEFQNDKSLRVWDYASGKIIATIEDDRVSKMYCGRYCTPNFAVYGGTAPNTMRAVDLNSYTVSEVTPYLRKLRFADDLAAVLAPSKKGLEIALNEMEEVLTEGYGMKINEYKN